MGEYLCFLGGVLAGFLVGIPAGAALALRFSEEEGRG